MILTRIATAHPVFASMMMIAIVVIGFFSFQQLSIDQLPDIDYPVVVVQTGYFGASPETVEADVTKPVENAVNAISGIESLSSRSFQGNSLVIIFFDLNKDIAEAAQEVRDQIATLEPMLPDAAEKPLVLRYNPDQKPILSLAIESSSMQIADLTRLAEDDILPRLTVVSGVGKVTLVGGLDRQVAVRLDQQRLDAHGVSPNDVTTAISAAVSDFPAGTLSVGNSERGLQIKGQISALGDFGNIVVARRNGQPVHLEDVADVSFSPGDADTAALIDGKPGLALDIQKIQGSNTVDVIDNLHKAVEALTPSLPQGVTIATARDNSRSIRASVHDVEDTLIEGAVLAIVIVFVFLNSWRSTVITGLTLPISIIGAFAAVNAFGFTLNTMTLMALSLAIGILIDDAIVVRENITRHLHMGKSHKQAALDGTNEIGLAVLATTLTIVAVFLPIAFMGGIIGRMFMQFGITVAVAVLISLFVSFTLDPMLSSVWYDPDSEPDARRGPIGRAIATFDRGFEAFTRWYRSVLALCLRHRLVTLGVVVIAFVISLPALKLVDVEFIPPADNGEIILSVETPVGSSLAYTEAKIAQITAALSSFDEIASTYATIAVGSMADSNSGQVYAQLVDADARKRSATELADPIRNRLSLIAGVTVRLTSAGPGAGWPIDIAIRGDDLDVLARLTNDVAGKLAGIDGVTEIDSSLSGTRPSLDIAVDPDKASDLGVSSQQIGSMLRTLVAGNTVATWQAPGDTDSHDITVSMAEGALTDAASVNSLLITSARTTANGQPQLIRLDQVARITAKDGISEINRDSLQREASITANVDGRTAVDILKDLKPQLDAMTWPAGYSYEFGGDQKNISDTAGYAGTALVLAVIFIYLILASQFGSFLQPIAIMAALPLSIVGVVAGLLVTGSTLNIFSIIGIIMLMGLVTKNAILLVDNANAGRAEGKPLAEALLDAGTTRLRPIMMTTLAMIFGMMPLALGLGATGSQRAPMAHAVIGGLVSSTILTLVVVPIILTYLDAFGRWVSRYLPKAPGAGETHAAE